ncbi:related to integral membrane protein [Fusarium fujikuroi IMI 58289]|uniref:Related to integral membrane protein n=1 Tax=Gibberella fujikuroi (strain CBS 195.34 / IMI 58289 / NRRL A-6831) TaxID=1279085 RepID=S0DZY9_GIBF5|nr:related to integral membrane protein [Fusarium fujikuroi IMI 58289]KLP02527.1 integral membrane protein [Fusarium fujikuroi]CCT68096.1 related to integral membrane protein [Fusarium fujikuroi IMI 58289]
MKLFAILRLFILILPSIFRQVGASSPTTAQRLEDASQCAIKCFSQFVDKPTFSTANKVRICDDHKLSNTVASCIHTACPIRDLFGRNFSRSALQGSGYSHGRLWADFLKLEQTNCGRPELDNDHNIRGINYTILGIAVFSIVLRTVTKSYHFSRWGADDYLIIAASVFTGVQCIIMGLMTFAGLGRNIWTLDDSTITTFHIYLLVVQYAYVLSLCLIKLSILYFFLRTFPDPKFRLIIKCTIAFNIVTTIIVTICGALQRQPIKLLWDGWKEYPPRGITLNIPAIIFFHAGVNIALDIWMFALPLTQLYSLGLQPKKKAGVMVIFGVGIFLIAASCIRIPYLLDFTRTLNTSSDAQGFVVWSNIESGVGILVACMPHMQPIFRAIAARGRSWNILPKSSSSSTEGIFVQRSLATIKMSRTDGTTLLEPDDLVLHDTGGLLSEPSSAKVDSKFGSLSETGTSR